MNSRSPIRSLTAFLCACAVLGVTAMAACSAPQASTSSPVTLGFSAWPGWFPWQVAQEQGLFAKNGLDRGPALLRQLHRQHQRALGGVIDANSQTLNDTIASMSGGAKLKIVLVNDNSTGNDKIIAREGINSVADLRGMKVAVEQGTVDHYLLQLALAEAGLTDKDIQLVPLLTDAAAAAFVAGQVDAVGAFAPFTTTALGRPGSRAIATSAEFPGAIPDHLVVSEEMAQNQPENVQALVNTWFDSMQWIKDNRQAAITIMAKRAGVSEADYETYDTGTTIFTRQQNIEAFTAGTTSDHLNFQANNIADFLVGSGLHGQQAAARRAVRRPVRQREQGVIVSMVGTGITDVGTHDSNASPSRREMTSLPRRPRPRWTSAMLAIRTPIPRGGRLALTVGSILVPFAGLGRTLRDRGSAHYVLAVPARPSCRPACRWPARGSCSLTSGRPCNACCSGSGSRCWCLCRSAS